MKKEIADEWIAALKSGEFRQGQYALNKNNKYSCLGVLCEIAYQKGICEKSIGVETKYDGKEAYLPKTVLEWAGLNSKWPYIESQTISLIDLNDSKWETFTEIANVIEKYWEEL